MGMQVVADRDQFILVAIDAFDGGHFLVTPASGEILDIALTIDAVEYFD
jgi:hypothetical protein